ncbi:hypothetical protein BSF38_05695 [Paludisphaera borealis]|uniref:Uncharacterized protein n=2 Tax=Paludisphaera borealis TaxID=1387353 RepID=A0A1U7CYY5_9BACT|nr:hypothetical protein BSF38_05695 [Paludisphaera borealis]
MDVANLWTKFTAELADDPLLTISLAAALAAFASTPIAVAVLGRMDWFKARRGRVLQRPSFVSIIVGTMLVMSIPATFAALVLKSRHFDENRYEFDPNRTWSVLDQGKGFNTLKEADAAVKQEMERLALERKNLVNGVKKLDQAMLALRASAGTSAAVAQAIPNVLESLAQLRQSINLDGPQQLMDFTAPPIDVRAAAAPAVSAPAVAATAIAPAPAPVNGLAPAQVDAELAAVPEPQKAIAAMLPLTDVPAGWVVEKSGDKYIETFNADNLYEKIDGRAESFLQYGVKGMAYTYYHPANDDSKEVQLYVFEMADPLRALGKFGSEKPDENQSIALGDGGYTSAGSTFLYAGKYYTQLVSTQDDPKFAAFALEIARRVAAKQKPGSPAPAPALAASSASPAPATTPTAAATKPADVKPAAAEMSPADYFALLPAGGRQNDPTYVPQDVFGYSFLSEVFMADYKEGDVGWQGFLRPYKDAKEAQAVLDRYVASVKEDGAEVKPLESEGADAMVAVSNIGLFDVVFRKGNTLAGANGATTAPPAEAFARALAKSLPDKVPAVGGGK